MSRKLWSVASFDKTESARTAYEYSFNEIAVLLLNARGIYEPEEIAEFLDFETELSDPFLIKDMDKAVERIHEALENSEKIVVYGDYDADGVTSTTLLYSYLEAVGADVSYYIPSRVDEGYGLHNEAVDKLSSDGIKLIITVDNGINSLEEASYIKKCGIDLIVTDHHQTGKILPEAVAVVNPHRADDASLFKDLAGVGVAFKLVAALEDGDYETVFDDFGDIAALGTIADIVPLKGENRIIAVRGINAINKNPREGIRAIKKLAGYEDKTFSSTNIAFTVAPRINAAGRIASAETALELLLTDNEEDAQRIAEILDGYNIKRQETEAGIVKEAIEIIESNPSIKYSDVLVVAGRNWHSGVIGIVASKLVDRYAKPAMVIAVDESGESKGSCRSIDGFSMFDALSSLTELLVRFGGHRLAAGFSINNDKIDEFRIKINEYAKTLPVLYPVMKLDCKINPGAVGDFLADGLELLEPYGAENPQPLFGIYNVRIVAVRPLGNQGKHIRLLLEKNGVQLNAVYFGISEEDFPYEPGDITDIAITVDRNEFRGESRVNAYVKAIKDAKFSDEDYFMSKSLYNKALRGDALTEDERKKACPDRNFAAQVFRYIKAHENCNKSPEQIAVKLGYGSDMTCRVQITLDAFCELELIKNTNGRYSLAETNKKTELGNSVILKKIGYSDK